ncbi:MAG TPA: indole-3-glycerol-phosphate synthase [Candidatus Thermoplasmatota archaeon]|nr:indole-3-glycerol-phosphate synthase [Candidatus Thermoplasmatota archaeon]
MSILYELAAAARTRTIFVPPPAGARAPSLAKAFARPGILAEIKPASPTQGAMRAVDEPEALARALLSAGAVGISALTEPTRFGGSPALLRDAALAGGPVLMKDFVVTEQQLDLARASGASAVLLILPLLSREHSAWASPEEAIDAAHARGLEVLLEVYDDEGYLIASLLPADLIGINNRDLREAGLPVDPDRAAGVLGRMGGADVPVLSLSGVETAADVRTAIAAGARGVLVGSVLMKAADPAAQLRAMMEGLR